MKYTASRIIYALFYAAAAAAALMLYDSSIIIKVSAVAVILILALIFSLWFDKKHPELSVWNTLFNTNRAGLIRLSAFLICAPLLLVFSSGKTTACAILAMWVVDSVYRAVLSRKFEIDQLVTAEAVLEKHPEAAKYINFPEPRKKDGDNMKTERNYTE